MLNHLGRPIVEEDEVNDRQHINGSERYRMGGVAISVSCYLALNDVDRW